MTVSVLLHLTVLEGLKFFGAKPDIIFSLVVFFGLFASRPTAIEAGVFSGLLKDIFSTNPFGLNLIVLSSVSLATNLISPHVYRESKFAQGLLTICFYIFAASLYCAFMRIGSTLPELSRDWLGSYFHFLIISIMPDAIYTSLASMIIFQWLVEYFRVSDRLLL